MEMEFPVVVMCCLLGVSRSAYYSYRKGDSYSMSSEQKAKMAAVKAIFDEHKRRYGARRIQSTLNDAGTVIGRVQVRHFMQRQDLVAIQPKSFVPKTTDSKHGKKRSENVFLEQYDNQVPDGLNQVWVGDITYIPLKGGRWCYLATWMDLYSRLIVGDWTDDNMEASLIIRALRRAFLRRGTPTKVVVHSDGGGQYVDAEFRELLAEKSSIQSMTRRDNHYDNAFAESLFSRMKAEILSDYPQGFDDTSHARDVLFEYIHTYYNRIRKHSSIGNMSPEEFEKKQGQ